MMLKWLRRGAAALVLAFVAAGFWSASHWNELQTKYAARRLQSATTNEDRARWADALVSRGDVGIDQLLELLRSAEPPVRSAAAAALDRHLNALAANDPDGAEIGGQLLELFIAGDDSTREALASLLPTIPTRCEAANHAKCKEAASLALKMTSAPARLAAIRCAANPRLGLRSEIVPLLNAAEADVRRAALFAVGPATDAEAVIGDEELFHWLHDPDSGVRLMCREVLVSRGRNDVEIGLGRRLAAPEAAERLQLLLDLRYDDDVADPEPWLERLSHDADPGVRAGSVRVVVELATQRNLPMPVWVAKLAEADPDATVRRIASFYRLPPETHPDAALRQVGAP
ncbi:MAG TPA: hypothetical protein VGL71_08610 [Urbifossiella sp.]|jgi:HEAT repeat protein